MTDPMSDLVHPAAACAPPRFGRFDSLLVANRGEIACRIIRSARAMGISTVAICSEADRQARHVDMADQAVVIGPAPAAQSYLDIEAVLDAAARSGAQAVHPGYGFLAENDRFAQACADRGLIFVGPSADAMRALGNKAMAKQLARRLNIPSLGEALSGDDPAAIGARTGYPLLIKAAAGGGGRGMRRVDSADAFSEALAAARLEALAAFGSDQMLVEPWIRAARHIEFQLIADSQGSVLHLGERDCSTQRRHQKILEEAPAPGLSSSLRETMGAATVALAREAGYVGAGTVEFLLADDGRFHFLEMNTRLQVEHPVTEMITGLDIVQLQLTIAMGEPLALRQQDIRFNGHAIEARLCAEDPWNGFVPQAGQLSHYRFPDEQASLRIDHGLAAQASIPRHYDSMIAKLIVHGPDRDSARRQLDHALAGTRLVGIRNNREFLRACLAHPAFVQATMNTQWLDESLPSLHRPAAASRWLAAAAALPVWQLAQIHGELAGFSSGKPLAAPLQLDLDGRRVSLAVSLHGPRRLTVSVDGGPDHELLPVDDQRVEIDGMSLSYHLSPADADGIRWLALDEQCASFTMLSARQTERSARAGTGRIRAGMHGQVAAVMVGVGDRVQTGQHLLSLESMKMEHRIAADITGTISQCLVRPGDQVAPDAELLIIEAQADASSGSDPDKQTNPSRPSAP